MRLERIPSNPNAPGIDEYVSPDGLRFSNLIVYVNKKRIAADIVALDTEEGWVDVEVPSLKETQEISIEDEIIIPSEGTEITAKSDLNVKRLTGKVKAYRISDAFATYDESS